MATTYTLTGQVTDALDSSPEALTRLSGYAEASQPLINDTGTNTQRVGRVPLSFDSDGNFTVALVGTGSLVAGWRVVLNWRDSTFRSQEQTYSTGYFTMTANKTFAAAIIDGGSGSVIPITPTLDVAVAALVSPGSATGAALTQSYARSPDPLWAWRSAFAASPSTMKIAGVGDSTMDSGAQAGDFYNRLRFASTQSGQPLDGMTGDTSHIISLGVNGSSLAAWLADSTKLPALAATAPNLVVFSWGINDVRLGATDQATMRARLVTFINAVRGALPGVPMVARIPSALTTTDTGGNHYVQGAPGDGSNVNPTGAAQTYSTLLRQAYLSLIGIYPDVLIWDAQSEVMGTRSLSTSPLMGDQIHPSVASYSSGSVPTGGGQVAIADALAKVIGFKEGAFPGTNRGDFQSAWRFQVGGSSGNNFVDLQAYQPNSLSAAQYPIAPGDFLYIEGVAGPITIPGSGNLLRPQGANIRLLISGTDFTAYRGRNAWVTANHAGATTQDRQIVSVDLPSVAAGAIGTTTCTVTGANVGDVSNGIGTAVVASPPAGFVSGGLVLLNAYPSAANTVTLVVQNPTGSAVDLAAQSWAFWVVR